jgi:hypothetical protein
VETEFDKYGGLALSVVSGSKAVGGSAAEHFYISGMKDGIEYLYRFANIGGQQSAKYVMFDGSGTPPAANPDVFVIGSVEYLLFAWGSGNFALYAQSSEDDERVYFTASALFDFSAIRAEVQTHVYKAPGWILCPEYNDARKTLYFTQAFWVQNAVKEDYINVRIWQSVLSGQTFGAPMEVQGTIDPFNSAHYVDGLPHDAGDFPGRMGLWWIGRLYMTDVGTKAFLSYCQ